MRHTLLPNYPGTFSPTASALSHFWLRASLGLRWRNLFSFSHLCSSENETITEPVIDPQTFYSTPSYFSLKLGTMAAWALCQSSSLRELHGSFCRLPFLAFFPHQVLRPLSGPISSCAESKCQWCMFGVGGFMWLVVIANKKAPLAWLCLPAHIMGCPSFKTFKVNGRLQLPVHLDLNAKERCHLFVTLLICLKCGKKTKANMGSSWFLVIPGKSVARDGVFESATLTAIACTATPTATFRHTKLRQHIIVVF